MSQEENCPVCFESLTANSEWPPLRCANHHKLCRDCVVKIEGGRYGDDPCSDECHGFHYKCRCTMHPTVLVIWRKTCLQSAICSRKREKKSASLVQPLLFLAIAAIQRAR